MLSHYLTQFAKLCDSQSKYLSLLLTHRETEAQRVEWVIWPKFSGGTKIETQFSQVFNSWATQHQGSCFGGPFSVKNHSYLPLLFSTPVSWVFYLSTEEFSSCFYRFLAKKSKVLLLMVVSLCQDCETHRKPSTLPQGHDSAILYLLKPKEHYP